MAELKIELIAAGDELLMGMTLDTNSHFIAAELSNSGFRLSRLSWVADKIEDIEAALKESFERSDIVIVTGGLGPTHDDLTRPVIASFFGDHLEVRDEIRKSILSRFEKRGLTPAPGWEVMAEFPSSGKIIPNSAGAAPGIHMESNGKQLFALPGVPSEMKGMVTDYILPLLSIGNTSTYQYKLIRTYGIGESHIANLIGSADRLLPVGLAFLPSIDHGVTLRLSLIKDYTNVSSMSLKDADSIVMTAISNYIYSTDERTIEQVIVQMMAERHIRLSIAESCTGGMVAARIIGVPGASAIIDESFITYSNSAKMELLGVPVEMLAEHGAVSLETALAMAEGVKRETGVDIGLSVTGIAGPDGGSELKPVGLVYIGISDTNGTRTKKYLFAGSRDENRRRATFAALSLLFDSLKK